MNECPECGESTEGIKDENGARIWCMHCGWSVTLDGYALYQLEQEDESDQ